MTTVLMLLLLLMMMMTIEAHYKDRGRSGAPHTLWPLSESGPTGKFAEERTNFRANKQTGASGQAYCG